MLKNASTSSTFSVNNTRIVPTSREELEHVSDLEAAAREILADTVPKELRPDPITGLLSDISEPLESASPTKNIAGVMGSLTLQPKAGAAVSTTSPSFSREQPVSENEDQGVSENEDEGQTIWQSTYQSPPPVTAEMPRIKGFLRDNFDHPLQEGSKGDMASTSTNTKDTEARLRYPSSRDSSPSR